MTGDGRLSTSSTSATDFSRPTSKGATAPGKRTALRIGNTGSSSPNWTGSSSCRAGLCFLSDMAGLPLAGSIRRKAATYAASSHPKHGKARALDLDRRHAPSGIESVDGEAGHDLGIEKGALLRHHFSRFGHTTDLSHGRRAHEKEGLTAALPQLADRRDGILRVPQVRFRGLGLGGDAEDVLENARVEDRDVGLTKHRRLGAEGRMVRETGRGSQGQ